MRVTKNDVYQLIAEEQRVGPQIEELLRFLIKHKHQSLDFFAQATEDEQLNTTKIRILTRALSNVIAQEVQDEHGVEFAAKVGQVLLRQFGKWDIRAEVAEPDPSRETNPWIRHWEFSKRKVTPMDYNKDSLKTINCLCEFYFGKRLLSNVKPDEAHTPQTWTSLKTDWVNQQAEQFQASMWQAGFLKCDLTR